MLKKYLGQGYFNLLEAGCGTGYYIMRVLHSGQKGLGIDFSEKMLELARINRNKHFPDIDVEFNIDDGENLSLPSDSFDRIIFVGYLMHLENPQKALDELYRVLKPGGRLVGLTSNRWNPWISLRIRKIFTNDYGILVKFGDLSPIEAQTMMKKAGFKNIRTRMFNSLPGKLPDWAYYFGRTFNMIFSVWPISWLGFHITMIGEK